MTTQKSRWEAELPSYLAVRIEDEDAKESVPKREFFDVEKFKRDYTIALIVIALFTVWNLAVIGITHWRTEKKVWAEAKVHYAAQLEQYKAEQAEHLQASYFLSGEASREAAINQEIDSVAQVISKLSTDAQKLTEASCMLARVLNPSYPNTFSEVANMPTQWMFFDGSDKTFSEHDRDLASTIVRPYMESGIVPNGLTAQMVYGEWTPNDFVLRDSYKTTSTMHTWRYSS